MLDPVEFGKAMAVIVREATAPLLKRIEQLETLHPLKGEKGDPGDPAEPIDLKEVVAELLSGNEISTLVDLHTAEGVKKYFDANPVQHGKDGLNGKDGKDGERGFPWVIGEKGDQGEKGEKGDTGEDGLGIAGAMIDRDGCLIVTTTKGAPINLGCVVGKNGERGKDGADLSTFTIEYDGHRTISIKAGNNGEIVKTYKLAIPMDAGYWREGMDCEKGDIVTHAGNAWLALADTQSKPGYKDEWRLFARKGRDGIDGAAGRNLGPAPPVKLSKDDA